MNDGYRDLRAAAEEVAEDCRNWAGLTPTRSGSFSVSWETGDKIIRALKTVRIAEARTIRAVVDDIVKAYDVDPHGQSFPRFGELLDQLVVAHEAAVEHEKGLA